MQGSRQYLNQVLLSQSKTMPLTKSKSKEAFKQNVAKEMASGKGIKQAVAIAHSVQKEAKKKQGE